MHWDTPVAQSGAPGRVSVANGGEKTRGFGHIRLRQQASKAELGLGDGDVPRGRLQHPVPQPLWHAVLAVAATTPHFYKSLTFGEATTPDHVISFLQPASASARLPARCSACAAPKVSCFSLILAIFQFLQSFLGGLYGMCPCWRDVPSQPCFIFLRPDALITCSLCRAAL